MEVNWGLLAEQGRCKYMGVPWNEEEIKARYELGIPAEYVRKGVLTLEEYKMELGEADKTDHSQMRSMKKEELKTLATELGLNVPDDAKRLEIISLISKSKLPASDTSDEQESLDK